MRHLKVLVLVGISTVSIVPLWASGDIPPIIETMDSLNLTSVNVSNPSQYTYTITYDNAGNTIQRWFQGFVSTYSLLDTDAEQEDTRTLLDSYEVTIKADATWSHVAVSILGDVSLERSSLAVYNLLGASFYSSEISDNYMSMDLSSLPKGVYIFSITVNGNTQTRKLIKHK